MKYEYYGLFDPRNDIVLQNLYGSDLGKQIAYYFSGFNFLGINPISMYDNANYLADYMKNTGVGWSDVKYPSRVSGSGSLSGVPSAGWMFSKNILSLYD